MLYLDRMNSLLDRTKQMRESRLRSFWIVPPDPYGPLGFGVTAFSVDDAFRILRDVGYRLPEDTAEVRIVEDVRVSDLDALHVVPNMGPIVVRGIWYPFSRVGV
jgi:hypothetical protein